MSSSPYIRSSGLELELSAPTRPFTAIFQVLRELLSTIVPAILVALMIHLFVAQATRVYGQSMDPNLHQDQRLVIEKVSYHLHGPQRGDVVVLKPLEPGGDMLIKRVIALAGERVEIHNSHVFVNGTRLNEPYLTQETNGMPQSWTVPPLSVFVMGDNRSASNDSRAFGPVPIANVVGHAWLRYWPLNVAGIMQ